MASAPLGGFKELLTKYDPYEWMHNPTGMHDDNDQGHPPSLTRSDTAEFTPSARKNSEGANRSSRCQKEKISGNGHVLANVTMGIVSRLQSHILHPHIMMCTVPRAKFYLWCLPTFSTPFPYSFFLHHSSPFFLCLFVLVIVQNSFATRLHHCWRTD